jgi:hypothetical protein
MMSKQCLANSKKLVHNSLPEKCNFANSELCPFSEQRCKSKSTFEGVILSNVLTPSSTCTDLTNSKDLKNLEKIPIESLYMYRHNMVNTCHCCFPENGFIDFKTSTCLKIWKLQDRILEIEQVALSTEAEHVLEAVNFWVLTTLNTISPPK